MSRVFSTLSDDAMQSKFEAKSDIAHKPGNASQEFLMTSGTQKLKETRNSPKSKEPSEDKRN